MPTQENNEILEDDENQGEAEQNENEEAEDEEDLEEASEASEEEADADTDTEETEERETEEEIDIDGDKIKVNDLKVAFKENLEYKKLSEEVNTYKKNVVERANNIQRIHNNLNKYIESLVPQEPSLSLLHKNPAQYILEQEERKLIIKELEGLVSHNENIKKDIEEIEKEDFKLSISTAYNDFRKKIPELKTEQKYKEFKTDFRKTCLDSGFSTQEIEGCNDARMLELVYFANIGKRTAEKMKNAVNAQKRIASKPQVATSNKYTNSTSSRNNDAFARLKRSGTLEDALKINY